jgi:hypothetical protein
MANKMLEELKAFMESPEGKKAMEEFANEMQRKDEREENNRMRMRKMFSDKESFDSLMEKICAKHNDAYEDRCYAKGYMPHPMNILYAIHEVADEEGIDHPPLDDFTDSFPSDIVSYMGWQFAITYGQGSVTSVYKNKELVVRL